MAQTCIEDTVGSHMTRALVTVVPTDSILAALRTMREKGISCLPIMVEGHAVGVVTEPALLDLVLRKGSLDSSVDKIAIPALTVSPCEAIASAIEKMHRHHAQHMLVNNKYGTLIGLVSQADLLEASRHQLARSAARTAEFEALASHDALTGLLSRRAFDEIFASEFERSARYGFLLAALFIDIDSFKPVNDRFGHAAGDEVLRRVGGIIARHIRPVDYAARYGGDEFVVLMPECGTRSASILAEHIRCEIEKERFYSCEGTFSVTVSAGGCKQTAVFAAPRDMLNEADRRLYEVKRNGGNRVVIREPE
jgi:diguanylate cyclase (GGDEF)-like protein